MQEETRGGAGVDAALGMLDLLASVGVEHFDLTHTNIDEEKRGFRAKRSLAEVLASMPNVGEDADFERIQDTGGVPRVFD